MSKKKTQAEKRIAAAPASAFRKLLKTELVKLGFSPKSSRYVETSIKRLTAKTKTISRRLFTTKETGFTPEAMAKAHAEGELLYKSRKTQAAAAKQILTRERTREERLTKKPLTPLTQKQIDRKVSEFEKRLSGITRVAPGPLTKRPREYYRMGEDMRGRMPDLLRRKLAGEWLVNGDWHQLADAARAAKHPDLARILQS